MSAVAAYPARPIKRPRRSKAEMAAIREAITEVLEEIKPATVRQTFYQLVSRGVVAKTEDQYKDTVDRLLTDMRRKGDIPYGWIADNTRWMRKPRTHKNLDSALTEMQKYYRRSLWGDQRDYVEIWLEKDALAGVVYDVTSTWDVPLMVTRGYPSLSFLADASEVLMERADSQEGDCYLYYFGDYDPSGVDIPRHTHERLVELIAYTDAADWVNFEVVAITPAQIREWSLPTRPTKSTDTRSKTFDGESVEVDAIPPDQLRKLVENCILDHVQPDVYERSLAVEAAERETLASLVEGFRGGRS